MVKIFQLLTLMLFIILFNGCINDNKIETLKIGTNSWPGYEPLYLAQKDNKYKENIKVNTYDSTTIVLEKYRSGEIHAAALTLDEVILLKSQGYSPIIITIMDISNGGDVIIAKHNIKSVKDLKDKSVGVENSALGSFMINRALELSHMSNDDIHIIPIPVDKHEFAFKDDIIDAVVTFEPVRTILLKFGAHEIFTSKDIPNEIVDVLVIDKKYFHQKYVKDIHQAINSYITKINKQDNTIIQDISTRLATTQGDIINSYKVLKIPTIQESNDMIHNGTILNTIDKIQNIMIKSSLISSKINGKELLSK